MIGKLYIADLQTVYSLFLNYIYFACKPYIVHSDKIHYLQTSLI